MCEVIFMSMIRTGKRKISGIIRAELCRIDLRCVIVGAAVVLLCGFFSSLAAGSAAQYRELEKPAGSPPAFLFPLVWTFLYLLIGGAAGAVACSKERALAGDRFRGLAAFGLMMILNFIWAPLFFGAGAYLTAFLDVAAMIVLTFFCAVYFGRVYLVSALAMSAYLLWLFYAAYLNLGILILN